MTAGAGASVSGRIASGKGFVDGFIDAVPVATGRIAHSGGTGRSRLVEILRVGFAVGESSRMRILGRCARLAATGEPEEAAKHSGADELAEISAFCLWWRSRVLCWS